MMQLKLPHVKNTCYNNPILGHLVTRKPLTTHNTHIQSTQYRIEKCWGTWFSAALTSPEIIVRNSLFSIYINTEIVLAKNPSRPCLRKLSWVTVSCHERLNKVSIVQLSYLADKPDSYCFYITRESWFL